MPALVNGICAVLLLLVAGVLAGFAGSAAYDRRWRQVAQLAAAWLVVECVLRVFVAVLLT